jgi:hypothetical protein
LINRGEMADWLTGWKRGGGGCDYHRHGPKEREERKREEWVSDLIGNLTISNPVGKTREVAL